MLIHIELIIFGYTGLNKTLLNLLSSFFFKNMAHTKFKIKSLACTVFLFSNAIAYAQSVNIFKYMLTVSYHLQPSRSSERLR